MAKARVTKRDPFSKYNFISVDPGLGGTGYAVWSAYDYRKLVAPVESGNIPTSGYKEFIDKAYHIARSIQKIAWAHNVKSLAIEYPQYMEHSGVGQIAARRGDLVKLTITAGVIIGALKFEHVRLVTPNEWKGTMPKDISTPRIMKRMELTSWIPSSKYDHEVDAVGIGLYVKGCFK